MVLVCLGLESINILKEHFRACCLGALGTPPLCSSVVLFSRCAPAARSALAVCIPSRTDLSAQVRNLLASVPAFLSNQRMGGALSGFSGTDTLYCQDHHLFDATAHLWAVLRPRCLLHSFWTYLQLLPRNVLEIYHKGPGPRM